MADIMISFDVLQVQQIERIILDQDGSAAVSFIEDLARKIKRKQIGCNPLEFRARQGIDDVIDKSLGK